MGSLMIPKVIYYAWFGKSPLPNDVKRNIETWKKNNPSYKIKQIDESNFDVNICPFTKRAYSLEKWAFVSDVARIYTILKNGGFYFDTDVYLKKPINSLRKFSSVWGMENSNAINSGLIMGAEKGDINLHNIWNIYSTRTFYNDDRDITVPIITNYFVTKGFKFKNRIQILEHGAYVFPTEYFAPLHWWGGGRITNNTIAVHQYSATWIKGKEKATNDIRGFLTMELLFLAPNLYFKLQKVKRRFWKNKMDGKNDE